MNIINKWSWVGVAVCFVIALSSVVPCPAQDIGDERSLEELFEQEFSVRIKRQRVKSKELRELGLVDESKAADIDFEGFTYELDFRNGAPVTFDDLKVECRFFYSVESSGSSSSMHSDTGLEGSAMRYESEEMTCSVKSNGRYETETRTFIIKSWRLPGGYYFTDGTPNRQECKEEGLWVRVTCTTPDGKELQQDFCDSRSLPKDITWDGKSI